MIEASYIGSATNNYHLMNQVTKKSVIRAILFFFLIAAIYELIVYLWSLSEGTPVIRADIFFIYPILLIASIISYFIFRRMLRK